LELLLCREEKAINDTILSERRKHPGIRAALGCQARVLPGCSPLSAPLSTTPTSGVCHLTKVSKATCKPKWSAPESHLPPKVNTGTLKRESSTLHFSFSVVKKNLRFSQIVTDSSR
jgi:hypothetical protein